MPPRRKIRRSKHTRLLVGEGLTEMLFLNYLKRLYLKRNAGLSLKIKQAQGGDPRVIVKFLIVLREIVRRSSV